MTSAAAEARPSVVFGAHGHTVYCVLETLPELGLIKMLRGRYEDVEHDSHEDESLEVAMRDY